MRKYLLPILLTAHFSCNPKLGTNSCYSNLDEQVSKIEKLISDSDPYQHMGHLRFPTHGFKADSFPLLDSNFVQSFVFVNYDTSTKRITRINVPMSKERSSPASRNNFFYYDEGSHLSKIEVLTNDISPQFKASYYFQNNNLICKRTESIEISDLDAYVLKIDTIYLKVSSALVEKGLIK